MALAAVEAGVEHADVEEAGDGRGIGGGEVLEDLARAKLWPWMATPRSSRRTVSGWPVVEEADVAGGRRLRVIWLAASWLPADDEDRDAGLAEARHLGVKKRPVL